MWWTNGRDIVSRSKKGTRMLCDLPTDPPLHDFCRRWSRHQVVSPWHFESNRQWKISNVKCLNAIRVFDLGCNKHGWMKWCRPFGKGLVYFGEWWPRNRDKASATNQSTKSYLNLYFLPHPWNVSSRSPGFCCFRNPILIQASFSNSYAHSHSRFSLMVTWSVLITLQIEQMSRVEHC